MGNNKIANVGTPTANTDAANKSYVDTGLSNKQNNLTFGIANTNTVKIDGTVENNDFAKFTSSGLVGRTTVELKSDNCITHRKCRSPTTPKDNPLFNI